MGDWQEWKKCVPFWVLSFPKDVDTLDHREMGLEETCRGRILPNPLPEPPPNHLIQIQSLTS